MTTEQFIKEVAKYVQKYAPMYGVTVYSPTIAQAILESSRGTSELAVNAHNYTGLKYDKNVSELPAYIKEGAEQNKDGSYSSSVMRWNNFSTFEKGIEGHFKFLFKRPGVTRYENLKGIKDPKVYLETIKRDGYATSLKYVDNLMEVIKKYNLTQYDVIEKVEEKKYYRCQVGAYGKLSNAEAMKAMLKKDGFDCIIKQYGSLYKCQLGAFSSKENCEALAKKVKAKGFECFITYC